MRIRVPIALACMILATTTLPVAAQEARTFFAIKAICTDGSPLPTFTTTTQEIAHEVRGWRKSREQACATVVDAPLFPGDRPRTRQKCAAYDMVDFTVMCRGGTVSAARWTAATQAGRDRQVELDGESLIVALKGDSGWGGTPARGFSGLTLARGGGGTARLPPGLGFAPNLKLYTISLPWQDIVSGRALTIAAQRPAPPPQLAPIPGWVSMLKSLWPWPQLLIGIPVLAYAATAAFGFRDDVGRGRQMLVPLSVIAILGVLFSARPADMQQAEGERVRQSERTAQQQIAEAERDRATMRQIIRISDRTGMVEPVSADELLRAKNLMGTRAIHVATYQTVDPTLWAALSLLPSLVLLVFYVPAFVRGRHYLFVAHPAGPVVAPSLRSGTLFQKERLGQALRPKPSQLHQHPPAYQSRNLLEKAQALKDKITADADIADAAMRRDRARAQQMEAEAELRAARRKLPWWKRWMIR